MSNNPYLEGNFAPVIDELTIEALPVSGVVPPELCGQLLRIGPNPLEADPKTHHWFLGNGMVHGLQLRDGKAEWYRSRYVLDDEVVAARGAASVPGPAAGTQLGPGVANTNVIFHAGQRLAIVEGGNLPVALDAQLETVARTDFSGTLPGGLSAHPHLDPDTGELHSAVYSPLWQHVQYVVLGADGSVRRTVDVPVAGQPMVHDCMITSSYFIIFDLPVTLNLEAAMAGVPLPYLWDPDYNARVGLLPREGNAEDVSWHEVEPCWVFHPMNGYEDESGRVVLDVVRHPKMFATDMNGPNEGSTTLDRWTIDPTQTRVSEQRLDDCGQEFPRIAEHVTGKSYRYGYSTVLKDGMSTGGLIKYDHETGARVIYEEGAHRQFMEGVFVAAESPKSEDDGYLMAYVYDAREDSSDVVILPSADLQSGPLATVHLPRRVPFGFHGNWVPQVD